MYLPSFYHEAGESNNIISQDLLHSSIASPSEACAELFHWIKDVIGHCLSKTEDGEQKECILAVALLVLQAAKENRRDLDIDNCRALHPSCKGFLSELKMRAIPRIRGLQEELCDRLVARITFAHLMKQRTDSRLSQLSKCECNFITLLSC